MDKRHWKALHRELRIIKREAGKATFDSMMYGSGFVRIDVGQPRIGRSLGNGGAMHVRELGELGVHHVPIQDVQMAPTSAGEKE